MRNYEVAYITDPELDEAAQAALDERVAGWITAAGGQTQTVDRWGKRRMAYPIRKRQDGVYVFVRAQLPAKATHDLERELRLQESILRFMITAQPDP
jgi:small subunit ribosomal protein S6